ncbi:GTP pyrophosphokinase [Carnobacteriaceae bacterium zg-ZUI78]|nr:GTP pyrophosphokinase [Carnobacteriaceae bacterium zg-ZUI78]
MKFSELALKIATKAHKGQTDKAGLAYIEHLKTVASFVESDEEKSVAYLHDVIEDTSLTLKDLEDLGFTAEIIEAVRLLTKSFEQDYQDYLVQVKGNSLARVVKLADLRHNSDLSRLKVITKKDLCRTEKYQKSIKFLST